MDPPCEVDSTDLDCTSTVPTTGVNCPTTDTDTGSLEVDLPHRYPHLFRHFSSSTLDLFLWVLRPSLSIKNPTLGM